LAAIPEGHPDDCPDSPAVRGAIFIIGSIQGISHYQGYFIISPGHLPEG